MSLSFTPEAPPRLVLASASPRRRELVALLGLPFDVVPSRYEEPRPPVEPVALPALVTTLATRKAEEVAARIGAPLVLGADTLVTLSEDETGVPLGKPTDGDDACRMLRLLSGRMHVVYTGISLVGEAVSQGRADLLSSAVRTRVRFRELTDAMIEDYVATGEPLDKAGAYGVQGYAAPFIEGIEGDYFNVVGLPLCEVGRLLERAGIDWSRFRHYIPRSL